MNAALAILTAAAVALATLAISLAGLQLLAPAAARATELAVLRATAGARRRW